MTSPTDLKEYATSTTDFYALLSLPPTFSAQELNRAWRRTALKYHPDKVGAADTAAAEKFHLAQIGFDIFQDPAIKTLYDNARQAREQKERARKMFEGERKRMREELEGREGRAGFAKGGAGAAGGVGKRGREEEDFERELRRLAEDGKRRRREREEVLRQDLRAEREAEGNGTEGLQTPWKTATDSSTPHPPVVTPVAELDRSVKVRWIPAATSSASPPPIDKDTLAALFIRFGKVESAFLMKTKTQRTGPSREKKQVATGVVVFTSVVGAHTAIEDAKKQAGPEWNCIESVTWAGNKEPDFVAEMRGSVSPAPQTPLRKSPGDFLNGGTPAGGGTPLTADKSNINSGAKGDGLRKVPSFASFSSAAFSTPQGSPLGKVGSPSLEEITMIRLKEAEKRRLEAEIARDDERADMGPGGELGV
ncbi:hypothetical protein MMC26_000883 [Xylographa opegraphella]|nr:hypothetical protein [Xylographa opegraphella]